MQITDKDLQKFRERAKTELQSNGVVGRIAWDTVVNALCNEVEELRKNAASGNVATLREALERVRDDLWDLMGSSSESVRSNMACEMSRKIRAALTAPARNVDRFNNATEAGLAYRNFLWERAGRVVDIDENMFFANIVNWLFAEAEGGKE